MLDKFVQHPAITFGGWLVGLVAVIFTAVANRRKAEIDESTLVLGKWKELVDAHEQRLKTMDEAFTEYRRQAHEEIETLRTRLKHVEEEFAQFRRESEERIRRRDDEIAGLKRLIAANSQSTAMLLAEERNVAQTSPTTTEQVRRKGRANRGEKP